MLIPRPRRCQAERRDSMAAQPPRDEGCKLVVSETVVDLEHAQFDRREALRRQAAGHTSHVLDGPDAISVSGREPDRGRRRSKAPGMTWPCRTAKAVKRLSRVAM